MAMLRVAVGDDDPDVRELIADLLREHGCDVVEAFDGASLLGALRRGPFALVIADLWMPSLSGADVVRVLRSGGDRTPFIIITAAPVRFTATLADIEDLVVLPKPFTLPRLLDVVSASLKNSLPARATPSGTGPSAAVPMDEHEVAPVVETLAPDSASSEAGGGRPRSEPPES